MPIDTRSIIREFLRSHAEDIPYLQFPNAVKHIDDIGSKKLFELDYLYNAQSVGFMTDLIPIFQGILRAAKSHFNPLHGTRYSLLDVGARSASGSELLARLFHSYLSVCIDVDVVDLDFSYKKYSDSFNHTIRDYFIQDAFTLTRTYDFVLSSHTIEHVKEPEIFASRLSNLSKYGAIFYCPLNEIEPISGHYTITLDQVLSFGAVKVWVVDSWWWRHVHEQKFGPSKCVIFIIPGKEFFPFDNVELGYNNIK